jgi:peptide/nickel transport system substrate-binding protein
VRGDRKLKLVTRMSLGYTGLTINLANTDKAKNPLGLNAKARQALELSIDRDAINQTRLQRRIHAGQSVVQCQQSLLHRQVSDSGAQHRESQGTLEGCERPAPDQNRTDGAQRTKHMSGRGGYPGDGRRSGRRSQSPSDRIRNVIERRHLGWSGRTDPDKNVSNHLGCDTPFNWGKYCSEKIMAALTEARTETVP